MPVCSITRIRKVSFHANADFGLDWDEISVASLAFYVCIYLMEVINFKLLKENSTLMLSSIILVVFMPLLKSIIQFSWYISKK
jgi:hypothetical protein